MGFSFGISEVNVVHVILGKGLLITLIETDGLPLGWSIVPLL